jgi:ankyrin repeat protein
MLKDKLHHSALHRAVAIGKIEIVNYLMENGADAELKDQDGWTALHLACYYYQKEIVSLLVEGTNVNIQNRVISTNSSFYKLNIRMDTLHFIVAVCRVTKT